MNAENLVEIISSGETSKVQLKRDFDHQDKIAAEIVAMANAQGGIVIFGVEDKAGAIVGLSYEQLQLINNKLANITSDLIKPLVSFTTEVVDVEHKKLLVVRIDEGVAKPYKDNNGTVWVKRGADKRKVTDNSELMRLFQESGTLHVDEMTVPNTSEKDIASYLVEEYLHCLYKNEDVYAPDHYLYQNLGILKNGKITLGGLLFFGRNPQRYLPNFCIKAVRFLGNDLGGVHYGNSRDIVGPIPRMFRDGLDFLDANLQHLQMGQNFNSVGILEIAMVALEELLQNALIHRDYTINAPVRLLIFDNRIEIISPGKLPNSLTVENIKLGQAVPRNNLLISYCAKLMPYRGIGSGIHRALTAQPNTQLINDTEGVGQFTVKIPRPEKE
ncbi:MAG: putative DNA binding domain-containing protein [Prevotellaceae bacterium]|nr:putative DNA binding domain-containing protein [Prevotellaceae bacterium]